MIARLNAVGYRQTTEKLENLKRRLAAIEARTDLVPLHRELVIRSYHDMMRQYAREIKLYEEMHSIDEVNATPPTAR